MFIAHFKAVWWSVFNAVLAQCSKDSLNSTQHSTFIVYIEVEEMQANEQNEKKEFGLRNFKLDSLVFIFVDLGFGLFSTLIWGNSAFINAVAQSTSLRMWRFLKCFELNHIAKHVRVFFSLSEWHFWLCTQCVHTKHFSGTQFSVCVCVCVQPSKIGEYCNCTDTQEKSKKWRKKCLWLMGKCGYLAF